MQDKNKNKKILMAMVGAYLVYTGGNLIVDVMNGEPENAIIFIIAGAAFVLIGAITVFFNMKSYIAAVKEDVVYTEESEDSDDSESEKSEPEQETIVIDLDEEESES